MKWLVTFKVNTTLTRDPPHRTDGTIWHTSVIYTIIIVVSDQHKIMYSKNYG